MKVVLLMTMLAVNGHFALEVDINIQGTLTCAYPFFVRVKVREADEILNPDDDIGMQEFNPVVGQNSVFFNISGTAIDSPGQTEVEPYVVIAHTCGGYSKYLCKYYTGITAQNSNIVLNVDLMNPDIGKCV